MSGSPLLCGDVVADVLLKDNREGNPDEPAGRGLNKGSNLESDSIIVKLWYLTDKTSIFDCTWLG